MGVKIPAEEKNYFLRWHLCLFHPPRPIFKEPRQGLGSWESSTQPLQGCRVDFAAAASTGYDLAKTLPCAWTWPADCQILANTGPSLTSGLTLFWINLRYGHVWVDLLGLSYRQHLKFLTHVQWRGCLSPPAAHPGHACFPLLCRTRHGGCTNLAISPIALSPPPLSAFALSVTKLHWPGTKQTLSIQHQPLVFALAAQNCLWDHALIERVIRHDFLVIAFNDLILSPSKRQRQLRALSIKDGAPCLTDLDLTWLGFLRVDV